MSTLKLLQAEFQDYLTHGFIQDILPEIAPDERFNANKRLKVYYDAYRIRLLEILKLDFSKTHILLGDEDFDTAFYAYLEQYPSRHFSVRYFGQYFSQFLTQTAPFKNFPILAEMACFEWSINHTLDAKDSSVLKIEALSTLSSEHWPQMRFALHPSVISHYFHWDAPQIWQQIESEGPPRLPVKLETPIRWIFWRKGIRSFFQSCTAPEDIMFKSLLAGNDFAQMCEDLLEVLPEDQIPLVGAQTLSKWIHEEMIAQIL